MRRRVAYCLIPVALLLWLGWAVYMSCANSGTGIAGSGAAQAAMLLGIAAAFLLAVASAWLPLADEEPRPIRRKTGARRR